MTGQQPNPEINREYRSPKGYHRHQCPNCKNIWEHSDLMFQIVDAHTCTNCGYQAWPHYAGPDAPTVQQKSQKELKELIAIFLSINSHSCIFCPHAAKCAHLGWCQMDP